MLAAGKRLEQLPIPRGRLEVDRLVRILIQPHGRMHRASPVARVRFGMVVPTTVVHLDETRREQYADLVQRDVAGASKNDRQLLLAR
jgi:hypothetical protein